MIESVGVGVRWDAMTTGDSAIWKMPFLSQLPESVAAVLVPHFKADRFRAGSVIFREGIASDKFSIVTQGRVDLEMHVPARGNLIILSLGPGDVLGWSPVLGGNVMSATAIAANDVQLLTASGKELRELCDREHEVGFCLFRALASALARRLLATRLQLLDIFSRESPQIGNTGAHSHQDEAGPSE